VGVRVGGWGWVSGWMGESENKANSAELN
jgi:hypothetical protein